MTFFRIFAYAVVFLLAWTGLAIAEPISTAIGLLATTIGNLGALGTLAFNVALQVGASLLQRALTSKPKQPGIKADIDVGGDNPLSFIVGTYATAGQLEYVNTSGDGGKTPNEYLTLVASVSDLPVHAFVPVVWVSGKKCTFDTAHTDPSGYGFPVPEYFSGDTENHLWGKLYDGRQTVADPYLLTRYGVDAERPWQSDMIFRGVSYAIITAQLNRELFTGPPECRFEVQGIRVYDPRRDSTVGGSGPQRRGNAATYEFSDNPAVIIYNILIGIYYDGEWIFGLQNLPATRLPLSNWFAAMNECDRLIALAEGGFEKQFRCGAEIKVDEQPIDVIKELLKGCNGKMAEIGGIYKIRIGAPTLPVYAFTDEAITVTNGQSFDPYPGLESVYNGANYTYPDPNAAWEMKDGPVYINPEIELQDDGQRLMADAQFNYVPFPVQAQRLVKALIENNRRFAQHKFTLPPEAYLLEPLDVVSYSSARNGYISKLFDLESMDDLANVNQAVALREIDPSDNDWTPGTDQRPTSIGFLGPIRPPAQLVFGWQVAPAVITDKDGQSRRPSIEVFFAGKQADVQGIRVQVVLAEDLSGVYDATTPYDAPLDQLYSIILNGVFLPAEDYIVRAQFVSKSDRAFDWTLPLPVTTFDIRLGVKDILVELAALQEDARNVVAGLQKDLDRIAAEKERVATDAALGTADNIVARQVYKKEIGTAKSLIVQETRQRVTETSALGEVTTLIQTEITDPTTGLKATSDGLLQISNQVNNPDTGLEAIAQAMLDVEAAVGNVSAGGLISFTAQVPPPAGVLSQINILARATVADAFVQSGLVIQVYLDGAVVKSKILILTDRLTIWDGTTQSLPFAFESGVAKLAIANIGDITAGTIRSPDNKFLMTIATGTLEWYD